MSKGARGTPRALREIGQFESKVSPTTDNKKLKKSSKHYTYGTISLRRREFAEYIGKRVLVKILIEERED